MYKNKFASSWNQASLLLFIYFRSEGTRFEPWPHSNRPVVFLSTATRLKRIWHFLPRLHNHHTRQQLHTQLVTSGQIIYQHHYRHLLSKPYCNVRLFTADLITRVKINATNNLPDAENSITRGLSVAGYEKCRYCLKGKDGSAFSRVSVQPSWPLLFTIRNTVNTELNYHWAISCFDSPSGSVSFTLLPC
jgi:hypothetical protein